MIQGEAETSSAASGNGGFQKRQQWQPFQKLYPLHFKSRKDPRIDDREETIRPIDGRGEAKPLSLPKNYVTLVQLQERLLQFGLENKGSRKFGENGGYRVKQEEEKMEKGTLTLALGKADNEIHREEEPNYSDTMLSGIEF
ncbi:hypothetical protein AMTR_s00020p00040860 [Amborella trichopoda]|uniref:Uncharacterized protein n=1 Tax=Amborella trichopoda TaxID=13333 RepID=W1PVH4_AMBTC|nr:hypothetical protein AMTR_s00020p00040860 [Amborella trichopoda]